MNLHMIFMAMFMRKSSVTYSYACRNIVNTIKTNGHSSLEKYTIYTLFEMVQKGYERVIVWEVSWRLNKDCNILTPSSSGYNSTSFLFSRAAQPEAQRPHCRVMAFFTASYQHLLWTPIHQGPKAPSAWCGFPYHISLSNSTGTPTIMTSEWHLHPPARTRVNTCFNVVPNLPERFSA